MKESSNDETGDYLLNFQRREDALKARARAVGVNLDSTLYRNWQTWFGDSAMYLNHLKNTVEEAEAGKS